MLLLLVLIPWDVSTSILTIVDAPALPRGIFRQVRNDLHGVCDGEEMHKADVLVSHNLHLVDVPEGGEIVSKTLLRVGFAQIAKTILPHYD